MKIRIGIRTYDLDMETKTIWEYVVDGEIEGWNCVGEILTTGKENVSNVY